MDYIEKCIIGYAGYDYKKPRTIEVDKLDLLSEDFVKIDDLIDTLTSFKLRNSGNLIDLSFEHGYYDEGATACITAYRKETEEEVNARIARYKEHVINDISKMRREYEEMEQQLEVPPNG